MTEPPGGRLRKNERAELERLQAETRAFHAATPKPNAPGGRGMAHLGDLGPRGAVASAPDPMT
ncbi:hypothetical protein OIE52_17890 [Streptomyces canus]|uniref:hypothetical protein n=1 Tax=Streptomyces canus TaxID=58343 RepID=UPI0030E00B76